MVYQGPGPREGNKACSFLFLYSPQYTLLYPLFPPFERSLKETTGGFLEVVVLDPKQDVSIFQ